MMKKSSFNSYNNSTAGLIIFLAAFVLRLIFLFEFEKVPLFDTPTMDMEYHHLWASAIANGNEFIAGPFFRAPLYPIFLGMVYYIFGESFWIVKIIQIILGSISALLVFKIGLKVFTKRTAVLAGFIMAACGPMIFFDGQLLVPSLSIFLTLTSLYLLIKALSDNNKLTLALSGLALGLSAIARPTILLFAVCVIAWLIFQSFKHNKSSAAASAAVFLAALLLPILPVTIHNYVESGQLTLIGTYSGMNLYIGNNSESDGVSAQLPGARKDWQGMMTDARIIAETKTGSRLTDASLSNYWRDRAISEALANPGATIKHLFRKAVFLMQGMELSNNIDFYFFAHQTNILKLLISRNILFFPFGLLFPLAVAGLFFSRPLNHNRQLLILFLIANAAAIVLFFVTARYRLPLVPVLALFASSGLFALIDRIRYKKLSEYVLPLGLVVIFLFVCNFDFYNHRPLSDVQGNHTMANLHAKAGRTEQAKTYYRAAIAEDSTYSQSYNDLALLIAAEGEYAQSVSLLKKAARNDPGNFLLHYNIGYVNLQSGNLQLAIEPFKESLRLRPSHTASLNNLGLIYQTLRQFDSAAVYYKLLVEVDQSYPDCAFNLAYCYQNSGQVDLAVPYFITAVEIDEGNAEALYNLGMIYLGRSQRDSSIFYLERFLTTWQGDTATANYARGVLDSLRR